MAVIVLTDVFLSLGGNDISDHVKTVTLNLDADPVDATAMGQGWKTEASGLKSGKMTLEVNDDFAAAQIDSILWGLFGTIAAFEVRSTSAAVGPSNPKFTGNVHVQQFAVGGKVGDLAAKSLSFDTSGAVARATA